MNTNQIQLLITVFIISAISYGIGFKCGSYYEGYKVSQKELRLIRK